VIVSGDISDPKSLELDGLWSPTSKVNFESFSPLTSPRIPGSSVNASTSAAHQPRPGTPSWTPSAAVEAPRLRRTEFGPFPEVLATN
jgi:hypothetical protein